MVYNAINTILQCCEKYNGNNNDYDKNNNENDNDNNNNSNDSLIVVGVNKKI